ncbi:et translation product-related [Anaeramoeba flamelloides]|uniref:Et translation product-related n=1 Tax=Anaeramoeba flamelloides TaxID=1746091 RepID=A0AAV8AA96_9EUKA|nr:et translation product-related [Anaeramoeba flamelloides]
MIFHKLKSHKNLIYVSLAFSLILGIYKSTQPLLTKVQKDLGYYALSLLYFVFAISLLLIAPLVKKLGPKYSMILGSFFYIAFQFVQIKVVPWVYLIVCGLTGFGASLIWTGFGTFIVNISSGDNIGKNTGFFLVILTLGNILSNLLSSVLLNVNKISFSTLFFIFGLFPLVGVCFFLLIDRNIKEEITHKGQNEKENSPNTIIETNSDDCSILPRQSNNFDTIKKKENKKKDNTKETSSKNDNKETKYKKKTIPFSKSKQKPNNRLVEEITNNNNNNKKEQTKMGLLRSLLLTFQLLFTKKGLLSVQAEIILGIFMAFSQGFLPMLMQERHISIVVLFYSITFAIFSLFNGTLMDKIGKLKLFLTCFMILILGCVFCFFLPHPKLYFYIIIFVIFSIGISGLSIIDYPLTSVLFPDKVESGIALFKFVKSITSSIGFAYVGKISLFQNLYLMMVLTLIAMGSLIYLDKKICPIDLQLKNKRKKKKLQQQKQSLECRKEEKEEEEEEEFLKTENSLDLDLKEH